MEKTGPFHHYGREVCSGLVLDRRFGNEYKADVTGRGCSGGPSTKRQDNSTFDLWLEAIDWSGIEQLWLSGLTPETLDKFLDQSTSIQKLESTSLPFINRLPNHTFSSLAWVEPSDCHALLTIPARLTSRYRFLSSPD